MKGIEVKSQRGQDQRGEYSELEKKLRKKLSLILSQLGPNDNKKKDKKRKRDKRQRVEKSEQRLET